MTTMVAQERDQAEVLRQLERAEIARDRAAQSKMKLDFANGLPVDFAEMRRLRLRVDDLENAKAKILHNRELKAQVDQIPAAEQSLQGLAAAIADRVKVRDQAIEEHNAEIRGLEAKHAEAHKLIASGKAARAELVRQCQDPGALAAVEAIDQKRAEASRELQVNQATRTAKWDALTTAKSRMASGEAGPEIASRVTLLSDDVRMLDERRAVLNQRIEELKAEREQAETDFLCNPDLI